ncbi:hypothetical protein [Paraburkholderia sp. MM6662-R1]|uniref:hypothetical protein n=1 Tax=Paraburkholderia sp. MM6662-R1 TaxID=2991066 RepID=UPI003D1E67ED
MRLIDRHHPDRVKRPLSAEETAAVRRFCGAGQDVQTGDVERVLAILEEMHDGRHVRQWLECDCWPGATTQPRLTARVREEGPRHFVRMHGYGEHRCALASFRQQPEPEDEPDDAAVPPGRHSPLKPVGDALDYLDDEHEGAARPGGSGGSASATGETRRRLPRLGRIMHTLLDDAGFATVHVDVLKEKTNSWERLKPYADAEAMSPELTLGQVLFTEPWTSINEKMAAIDALPWPEKKARSALLLFVADEIRDGAAIKRTRLGERIVRPEKGIRAGGRDERLTQPPYWVLAVVDRDREGSARYREAFAQHAYSFRQPVPLDSRYERLTLECLFRVMEWVRTRGADEPGYLERKSRTHGIMEQRGILLEHVVADDTEQRERDDAFFRRVGAKILHLAGVQRSSAG